MTRIYIWLFPLLIYLTAMLTIRMTGNYLPLRKQKSKLENLDGFRGWLALSVFACHALAWQVDLKYHEWGSASRFAGFLGHDPVSFFFMITAFLFFSKILRSDTHPVHWSQLFAGRIFRILPLFYFMLIFILIAVGINTEWHLQVTPFKLASSIFRWLLGMIVPVGVINNFEETGRVVAGVYWTLSYEWCFYLSLPALSLLKYKYIRRSQILYIIISPVLAWLVYKYNGLHSAHFAYFLGGMAAAYTVQWNWIKKWAQHNLASLAFLLLLILKIYFQPTLWIETMILTVCFIIIINGNTMFKILVRPSARRLGEISYSVYLLHGIVLYYTFRVFLSGKIDFLNNHPLFYYLLVILLTIPMTLLSLFTYKNIELKAMQKGKKYLSRQGKPSN